jgi:hypothetical protein
MVMENLLCASSVQRDQYAQLWWRLAMVTLYMREQQVWKTSLRRKVGPIGMEDCSWKRRILRGRRVLRCNFFAGLVTGAMAPLACQAPYCKGLHVWGCDQDRVVVGGSRVELAMPWRFA